MWSPVPGPPDRVKAEVERVERTRTTVLSAWSPRRCDARALAAGASLYLQKPVSGSQLIEAIKCVLAQRED